MQQDQVQKYLYSQGERYAYKLQPCIKTQLNSCIIQKNSTAYTLTIGAIVFPTLARSADSGR